MTYKLRIERWHPYRLNQLINCHWRTKDRRRKADDAMVGYNALQNRLPIATSRRRVDLHITLGPRGREGDEDNWWKSIKDALKNAKLLIDDSRKWCEQGKVTFERGPERATMIILTEL
jgi:Holliday junction resolvase RusA-like endonuclease